MIQAFVRQIFTFLIPPPRWRLAVIIVLGALSGLGALVLRVSNAISYLGDDPATCVNCHIMAPEYTTWLHGSHGRGATCNDCHVPHDSLFRKYWFKAQDGLRHAAIFTLRMEPQVIWAREGSDQVIAENCLRCHGNRMRTILAPTLTMQGVRHVEERPCWTCHRETPHGRVHSLASTPHALIPRLSPITPPWMDKLLNPPSAPTGVPSHASRP